MSDTNSDIKLPCTIWHAKVTQPREYDKKHGKETEKWTNNITIFILVMVCRQGMWVLVRESVLENFWKLGDYALQNTLGSLETPLGTLCDLIILFIFFIC